eukprot:1654470-Rhodomonas_salina.1
MEPASGAWWERDRGEEQEVDGVDEGLAAGLLGRVLQQRVRHLMPEHRCQRVVRLVVAVRHLWRPDSDARSPSFSARFETGTRWPPFQTALAAARGFAKTGRLYLEQRQRYAFQLHAGGRRRRKHVRGVQRSHAEVSGNETGEKTAGEGEHVRGGERRGSEERGRGREEKGNGAGSSAGRVSGGFRTCMKPVKTKMDPLGSTKALKPVYCGARCLGEEIRPSQRHSRPRTDLEAA